MYDDKNDEMIGLPPNHDDISETEEAGNEETYTKGDGDQTGLIANFIRNQPVLTLSLAFGLGLLATSLLARKRA